MVAISFTVGRDFKPRPMRIASCTARSPAGHAIAVTQAEQEVDIRGPGADAMQRSECVMRFVGRRLPQVLRDRAGPR